MSTEATAQVVHELEFLPEADQRIVLSFLANLKQQRCETNAHAASINNSRFFESRSGLLVFTGKLDAPDSDWVRLVRDERDGQLMQEVIEANLR